jgi:hypothetical protein
LNQALLNCWIFGGLGCDRYGKKDLKAISLSCFLKIKLHRNLGTHSLCLDLANCTISLQRIHILSAGSISGHTYFTRIECTQPLKLCECNMYGEQRHGKMPKCNILEHEQFVGCSERTGWTHHLSLAEPYHLFLIVAYYYMQV